MTWYDQSLKINQHIKLQTDVLQLQNKHVDVEK